MEPLLIDLAGHTTGEGHRFGDSARVGNRSEPSTVTTIDAAEEHQMSIGPPAPDLCEGLENEVRTLPVTHGAEAGHQHAVADTSAAG